MKILQKPGITVALGCFGLISASALVVGFSGQSTLEQRVARLEGRVESLEKVLRKTIEVNKINLAQRQCISNLKQIESAKEQWAMVYRKGATDTPTPKQVVGDASSGFLRSFPACPLGGTYTIGNMSTRPTCSLAGSHGHALN